MALLTISTSNTIGGCVISPDDIRSIYLYGINTVASDGRPLPDDVIEFYIDAAVREIETFCDIKILPQLFTETLPYRYDDVIKWGYIKTTYPVAKPLGIKGRLGNIQRIEYPNDWLTSRQSSDETFYRRINIVPASSPVINTPTMLGVMPLSMYTNTAIPFYWDVSYYTGYSIIPSDLVNFVGKLAAINIFNNLGDLILGAGIASQSIGIDGLSQSISTTSSAENSGYSSRAKAYLQDLKESLPRLRSRYGGIRFESL